MWNVCVQPSPGHFICDIEQSLTEQHLNLEKREKATFTHVEDSECNSCFTCNHTTKVKSDTTRFAGSSHVHPCPG